MNKEKYINIVKETNLRKKSKQLLLNQIKNYYEAKETVVLEKHNYKIGDDVFLLKGTLIHGTYKNIEGLKEILKDGLISSWFIDGRLSKYPSSVGVWNFKKNYFLKDYINFYSGATILYSGVFKNGVDTQSNVTDIISYDKMNSLINIVKKIECHIWIAEQTKEARFLPSLVQDRIQIGVIFNGQDKGIKELLKGDILSEEISDIDTKGFVNPKYYKEFIEKRKNKDDFFTDRESAILFGIPASFIEGILVGRKYEHNKQMINKIKKMLPYCYICNLDGKVIEI